MLKKIISPTNAKRALSLLLAVTLLFGAAPLDGFVGLELPKLSALFASVVHAADPTSGTCGANLTWSYNTSTKTLTISGTGAMNDYSVTEYGGEDGVTDAPWRPYFNTMKTVVINSGVTSIGDHAFYSCIGLTSVTIPNGVKTIGALAFNDCKGLKSFNIPKSVTSIGYSAFCGCSALISIAVDKENAAYYSPGSCLIERDSKELICGCKNTVIPTDGSVTSIGDYAFTHCTELTNVTIPDSVTSIGYSAFNACSGLTSVTIPDSVTSIDEWAFVDCTGLMSVTIGNGVTYIGQYTFGFCTSLTSVTIGDNVTSIGSCAFEECTSLMSIIIPVSVTRIAKYAFDNCSNLKNVYYSGSIAQWKKITISDGNDPLTNATIHYNSGEPTAESIINQRIDFEIKDDDKFRPGTTTITFKSAWFNHSNSYNHDLARFCADYAMMGYCGDNTRITNYLNSAGFNVVDKDMEAERDEVNYYIATKDIAVNGEVNTLVFLGLIGSYKKQWYSNFDPLGYENKNHSRSLAEGIAHRGFADARDFAYGKLKAQIDKLTNSGVDSRKIQVLITGHSRGAAAANLLSAKLMDSAYTDSNSLVKKGDLYTYPFATPNVALTNSCPDNRYQCIYNVVNPEDFVTKVLLKSWDFSRYGTTYTLPSKTNYDKKAYKTKLRDMQHYIYRFIGDEYEPYTNGEAATYEVIKKMGEYVKNLNDFYHTDYTYRVFTTEKPFEFFKLTVLSYLSKTNQASAVANIIRTIINQTNSLYSTILLYFLKTDWLDTSLNLNPQIAGDFIQAHMMPTYCAYMKSLSSAELKSYKSSKYSTVNCPVDIDVFDNETGELVGRIKDNVVDETIAGKEDAIVMSVEGDSKSYWLPSNGDYRVVLTGNNNGTMDYTVAEIDSDIGETERANFFDVEIKNGVSMTESFDETLTDVSNCKLTLAGGTQLAPTETVAEENKEYQINTTTEGSGYVSESQTAVSGDYVQLAAEPVEGGEFLGWYENGKLISSEAELSFVAKANRNLTAKFTVATEPATLSKIAVKTMPTKTTYTVGDSFDSTGLTLTVTYSDNSTKIISSGFTCSGFSSTTAGTKTVTVAYEGKTTTFTVDVVDKTYTLTYDANGGSVSPSSKTVTAGSSVTLPTPTKAYTITYDANGGSGAPSAQKLTLTCKGWSTLSSATSASYSCGSQYTPSGNVTLYAVWSSPVSATLSSTNPTRSGYKFLGWANSSSASSATYAAGESVSVSGNATLYAVWEKDSGSSDSGSSVSMLEIIFAPILLILSPVFYAIALIWGLLFWWI